MGGKTRLIDVPEGIIFHLTMGHVWSSEEDRDTYNFAAIIPYSKTIKEFIVFQKDLLSAYDCNVYNILDKYLVWLLKDATPIEKEFPFTLEEPQVEPLYIKELSIDFDKKAKLIWDILQKYRDAHDGRYPDGNEYLNIERRCEIDSSSTSSYIKVNNLNGFSTVDVTRIIADNKQLPGCSITGGIIRQYLEYPDIVNMSHVLIDEEEFNNALSMALQEINVMF